MNKKSQELNFCIICKSKTRTDKILCVNCTNDPFLAEDARSKLAFSNNHEKFLETYSLKYPEIKNINTSVFWNNHFNKELKLIFQDAMTRDKINLIISLLPQRKIKILDVGFGQGYFEEKLQFCRKDYEVNGIDISKRAVEKANRKFTGNFIIGDISNLESLYDKKTFDIIIALELVEHISPKKIFKFYNSVHSLLKKDGVIILSTPLNEGLEKKKVNPSGHVRAYQPAIIKMELEISGFRVLETHELYAFKRYYPFKKFLAKIFRNQWKPNNIIVKAAKK